MNSSIGMVRTFSIFVVFVLIFFCLAAHALPPWLQRGGGEQAEEKLQLPEFDVEQDEPPPYFYTVPERSKGPFLWIFVGFVAAAFITSL